jgi:hypothetical protein
MEIAIWTTANITNEIHSDNLVSEARWERLVLEALLASDEIEKVYSVLPIWNSSKKIPSKLINGTSNERLKELNLIAPNDWPLNLRPKGFILNNYYSCYLNSDNFQNIKELYKDKIFTIDPYDCYSKRSNLLELTKEYLEDFFIPRIPFVKENLNQFEKNILLWPHKGMLIDIKNNTSNMEPIFNWIAKRIELDSKLEFHILSGMHQSSFEFFGLSSPDDYFWNSPITKSLLKFKNKVFIHSEDKNRNMFVKSVLVVVLPLHLLT